MRALNADNIIGGYGPRWRQGILSEHLDLALQLVGKLRIINGKAWVTNSDGDSWPVVCSEVVPIRTEDGTIDGRCGEPVILNPGTNEPIWCVGHDLGADWAKTCEHGLTLALCAGPGHYPMDDPYAY